MITRSTQNKRTKSYQALCMYHMIQKKLRSHNLFMNYTHHPHGKSPTPSVLMTLTSTSSVLQNTPRVYMSLLQLLPLFCNMPKNTAANRQHKK